MTSSLLFYYAASSTAFHLFRRYTSFSLPTLGIDCTECVASDFLYLHRPSGRAGPLFSHHLDYLMELLLLFSSTLFYSLLRTALQALRSSSGPREGSPVREGHRVHLREALRHSYHHGKRYCRSDQRDGIGLD